MSTSKPTSIRSSIDDVPSKAPSTTNFGQARALSSSRSISTHKSSHEASRASSDSLPPRPSTSAHPISHSSLQTTSVMPNKNHRQGPVPHVSQASSGISKPSTTFVTAHGESHALGNATSSNENRGCVGQMNIGEGPRGPKNPHGISLDSSKGYFSQGSEVMLGTTRQTDTIQLNDRLSLDELLRMIAAERLHHMPQKGSNWDRSIRILEYFALNVSGYVDRYISIVGNVQLTATMLFGRCSVLLQLGRSQATSLVPALGVLTATSHALSLFASYPPQPTSSQLQPCLSQVLDRTLDLLNGITSYFQDLSVGLGSATGPLSFRCSLSKPLDAFDLQADELLNEMWNYHYSTDIQEPVVQFKQVQVLLQPQDEVVRETQRILLAEKCLRHEFTCEWFSKPFLDFIQSSDSTLWVDGCIGCGKSVLYGWILESLQNPVDRRQYAVVSYAIDLLLPSELNTTCVIKALLLQLVERLYGSSDTCRAIAKLMEVVTTSDSSIQIESAMWECLRVAIGNTVQPTMLVIDGLSELDGGETAAAALFQALLNLVAGNSMVRLLILSRPFDFQLVTPLRRKTIHAEDVHKDARSVITDLVPSHSKTSSAEVAQKILHKANGSFLWSLFTLQDWAAQDFSLQTWKTLPTSLDANVAILVSKVDLSDPTTCLVIFNVIIATRPLRLAEIEAISRLDVINKILKPQAPDIKRAVKEACGSVLVIQDGVVFFRHALLRQALLDTLKFGILSLGPEMHADMACRLLLYMDLVLTQHSELTLKSIPSSTMVDLFHFHPLLSYALRYWTNHAIASAMYDGSSFKPSKDCKLVFPDSVNAAIVEASFWTRNPSRESLRALRIAATARKEILGNTKAALQTRALLAEALRSSKDYSGALINLALAFELSQLVLPEYHPFTATCALGVLDVADLVDDGQNLDLPSQKASALRYMIGIYDAQYGHSSDQSLEFSHTLAAHYAAMQEHALSTEMYQNIHRLTIDRYGRVSSQAKLSSERLATALQSQSEDGASPYSDFVYEDILQTHDVTDARRIKASIAKAESHRSLGDPFNAELVYISLWHGVADACRLHKTPENHVKLLETGIAYAKFLCEYDRFSDTQTVLLVLWSQQSALGYTSATINLLLYEVAKEIKLCGLPDVALDVLNHILACSETQDPSSSQLQEVKKAISDITIGLVSDDQSNLSREAALGLSSTDASIVNTLISKFSSGNRFHDVVALASQTLYRLWPSIMEESKGHGLETLDQFDSGLANVAVNLAQAYIKLNRMEKAGPIYWHLYQAARHSKAVDDDSNVIEYADLALTAFEQTGQINQVIAVREDLLDYCVVKYGERRSIESRYALASLYFEEQLSESAKKHYSKITSTLKQQGFHESAAVPALKRLIEIYSRQKAWDQALEAYASLWDTFLVKGSEFDPDFSTFGVLFVEYTALLRKHDSKKVHEVIESYRSACCVMYGERNPATLEASLLLAESWNNEHPASTGIEARQLYEFIVDGEEDTSPQTAAIVQLAEERLVKIYEEGINDDYMHGGTILRAVRLQGKKYQREKIQKGASQAATLSSLAIWISMLTKQDTPESRAMAAQELQWAIDSVIELDVQPSSLYGAAIVLATSFSAHSYVEEGLKTVQRLTEQVIFEQEDTDRPGRRSNLIFLTAFEAYLTGSMVDFAEVHSKVLMETALWERYKRLSHEGTEPQATLACGAKLRSFLIEHNSPDRGALIEDDLFQRFQDYYVAAFSQGAQTVREFFCSMLSELGSERLFIDIPELAIATLNINVSSLLQQGRYQSALDLALPGFEFISFVETFGNGTKIYLEKGLELGLMLARTDVAPIPDQVVAAQMLDLSKKILRETLQACRSHSFNFNMMNLDLISRIASVLGLQQNYEDLEWLLSRLWLSRKTLTSISQDVIVIIGRRLVEVRFFHGHVDSAIELGEDILYNVQRVYGTSHPSTVGMANFLSSMYMVNGDEAAALAVVGDASQLKAPGSKRQPAKPQQSHTVDTVKPNIEYLMQFYQRNSKAENSSQSAPMVTQSSEGGGDSNNARDVVRTVQQPPSSWGFIDRGSERGFGGTDDTR